MHLEDLLESKLAVAKCGFPQEYSCSADGDSDPSRCAETSRLAGRQDASWNTEENRTAHLEEAES